MATVNHINKSTDSIVAKPFSTKNLAFFYSFLLNDL